MADSDALKVQNEELKAKIEELEHEITRLQDLNARLSEVARADFKQPPPEVLRMIFEYVIPPAFLLDPSVSCGPDSAWCQATQAKLTLINVCWSWYRASVDMLYEDVAFRDFDQISALCRTVSGQRNLDFGRMIKHIGVHCIIPDECLPSLQADLNVIVTHTPRLTSVTFHGSAETLTTHPVPITFSAAAYRISHLDCGPLVNFPTLLNEFNHLSSTLVSLSFNVPKEIPQVSYHLSRLETLKCVVNRHSVSQLPLLANQMVLPSLKTFTYHYQVDYPLAVPLLVEACLGFCKVHGQRLRTLCFRTTGLGQSSGIRIQPILDHCPDLDHLILHNGVPTTVALSHPKVQWVDFWSLTFHTSEGSPADTISANNFPAIKGVREFATSASLLFGDIPLTLPPHLGLAKPFQFEYPGLFFRHEGKRVFRNDAVDCAGEFSDEYQSSESSDSEESIDTDFSVRDSDYDL
ncbi:hypothetical protein C8J57DRAFT_580796 [Mycena rebaudengoi]|nr:hypothetical protein C8J57DRAFT_580796 [Mycena rebaudengoi]